MAQGSHGRLHLWNDFTAVPYLVTETEATTNLGDFYAGGASFTDTDAGVAPNTALMGGVVTLTSANGDADTSFIGTGICLDVALMGTLVLEARVQMPDVDTKEIFFGITSVLTPDEQLEDIIIGASSTAVTVAADCAGFYFSDELTISKLNWHGFSGGGTAADQNTAATNVLNKGSKSAVTAGEWQQLRLEVDNSGEVRWYINGVLEQTVANAVSLTSDVAAVMANGANTTEFVITEIDFMEVWANRDWAV